MALGDMAAAKGQEALAQSYYEKLKASPLATQGESKIWEVLARQGDWQSLQSRVKYKGKLTTPLENEAAFYYATLASWRSGGIAAMQNPKNAAEQLKNLKEPPYSLLGPLLAVEIYQAKGDERMVAFIFCSLAKNDPAQAEDYLFSAAALLIKSSPDAAAHLYRRVIEMEGKHVLESCVAYAHLGHAAEAYALIKKEIRKNPDVLTLREPLRSDLLINLSLLAYQLGEAEDLYIWADRYQKNFAAQGLDIKGRKLMFFCGELAAKQGEKEAALAYYKRVMTENDDLSLSAALQTGKILIQEGRGSEAKKQLIETARKNKKHPNAYQIDLLLAQAAIQEDRDFPNYAFYLEEACQKNSDLMKDVDIRRQLFKAYYHLKRYDKAALHLKEIYQQHPESISTEEKRWFTEYADQHPRFLSNQESTLLLTEAYAGYRENSAGKEILRNEFEEDADLKDPRIESRLIRYIRSHPVSEEDPLFCYLQQVAHCREFDHEPNHFEAALELVERRHKESLPAWYSALFSFKEWFLSKEDIPARDYHAAKDAKRGGVQLFEGYMLLIDGELTRLEAEIAFENGREGEGRKKRGIAVKIYKNLLHGSYGVTPYLLDKAKERSIALEQQEP